MFPVEAPRDLQLALQHRLGSRDYIISLALHAGDSVSASVQQAFREFNLPFCMYGRSVEYTSRACADALRNDIPMAKVSSIATDEWDTQEADSFFLAYDYLLRRYPYKFRTLGALEECYLKSVSESIFARSDTLATLREKHSEEMEMQRKLSEGDDSPAQRILELSKSSEAIMHLVAQHVAEIEAVERHWSADLENLKDKQRSAYRELIMDLYEPREAEMEKHDDEDKSPRTEWGPLDLAATLRVLIGARCFCIRLFIGNLVGVLDVPDITMVEDGCGPQIPAWCSGLQSYRYNYTYDPYFPAPTKSVRSSYSGYSSPSFLYWDLPEAKTINLSAQAYASEVSALVLCTHWTVNAPDSSTAKEIHRRLKQRTDLHFPSLSEQMAMAPLKPGAFICTRHSNLGGSAQVIFHTLVPDATETNALSDPVRRSLERIVETADAGGVCSLWVPALLMDATGVSLSAMPYENARTRIEVVVNSLRSSMDKLGDNGSLKVVNIILPSTAAFMKMGPKGQATSLLDRMLHFIRDAFVEV